MFVKKRLCFRAFEFLVLCDQCQLPLVPVSPLCQFLWEFGYLVYLLVRHRVPDCLVSFLIQPRYCQFRILVLFGDFLWLDILEYP